MSNAGRKSGVELLEESVDLLRRAPSGAWAWYLAGAVPFFGGALIFWSRMTGVTAVPDPLLGALAVALLFGWRQYSRAWFAGELYRMLSGGDAARHSFGTLAAVWFAGIARIPLLIIPFPVVIALFRNVAVIAPRAEGPLDAFGRAGALASRGSDQFVGLITLAGASVVIWFNVFTGMLTLPALVQIFTGQDLVFLRNSGALLNGTVMLASLMVAWGIVDVVLAAFYALRVFYGESEETGADLLGAWRRALARAAVVASVVLCVVGLVRADEKPRDLRQAVDRVLQEQPYQWRGPLPAAKDQNAFVRFTDNLMAKIHGSIQAVKRGLARFIDWLKEVLGSRPEPKGNAPPPVASLRAVSWLVIVVLAGALVALFMRTKILSFRRGTVAPLPAGPVPIDLSDPSVLASQLPENEWIDMARDFVGRGEYRMALRAYFLASLAFLAAREMLVVGRYKTNLDYLREVRRRARGVSGLEGLFAGGIRSFESAWYGAHEVGDSEVRGFAESFERMRGLVGGA